MTTYQFYLITRKNSKWERIFNKKTM